MHTGSEPVPCAAARVVHLALRQPCSAAGLHAWLQSRAVPNERTAPCLHPHAQFITHTVGRVLGGMALASTPIDTRGFQSLLSLVDNTTHDSFDLYYGLFMYNEVLRSDTPQRPPALVRDKDPAALQVCLVWSAHACMQLPDRHAPAARLDV